MHNKTVRFSTWSVILYFICTCVSAAAEVRANTRIMEVDGHPIHIATWGDIETSTKPWVVLISGPIDSWHSDTAWYAAAAPLLAETYRVIAVDRAGLVNALPNAPVGYAHFAIDLAAVLEAYRVTNATLVAFASGNLTAIHLLKHNHQSAIANAVLIDPDVLTPFSVARYTGDAAPFKDNLETYLVYISEGKYTSRVEQKNQADMEILKQLSAKNEVDWDYVTRLMKARLKIINQQNLFAEIAQYDQDLNSAMELSWPSETPTLIIDSHFEQDYIDNTEEENSKEGLEQWQIDGRRYYQKLAKLSHKNHYVEIDSRAHLFQFEQPQRLLNLIDKLRSTNH